MAQKMTKRDYFAKLRARVADDDELVAFIDHEVELLEKKAGSKTPTKTQKENEGIKSTILDVLATYDHPVTISDLMTDDRLAGFSNQKISALLYQLGENGSNEVVRTVDKKKAYFAIAK